MIKVTIVFRSQNRQAASPQSFEVNALVFHLYGFIELQLPDGTSTSYSLADIHSITYPTGIGQPKKA